MWADAQKAADHNGCDQTIRPRLEKGAGLKTHDSCRMTAGAY